MQADSVMHRVFCTCIHTDCMSFTALHVVACLILAANSAVAGASTGVLACAPTRTAGLIALRTGVCML